MTTEVPLEAGDCHRAHLIPDSNPASGFCPDGLDVELQHCADGEEGKAEVVSKIEYDDMRHMTNVAFNQIY